MEEKNIVLELPNGDVVKLVDTWKIDTCDSYSEIEIYDYETGLFIGSFRGTLPDVDDEDFNIDALVEKVKESII
jgi:hypothetical protein